MGFPLAVVLAAILVLLTLNILVVGGVAAARVRAAKAAGRRELDRQRREIGDLERSRDELEHLSMTDPLTGVPNYRFLQLVLDRELERASHPWPSGAPQARLALLLVDVDTFREVNRRHGHQRGSVVLRELAERIRLEVAVDDTLARYGGDEFVVLLRETPARTAADVAARICYAVRKQTFDLADTDPPGARVGLTVSIGIAVRRENGVHAATLLHSADQALACAKEEGGDRFAAHQEPARVR